MSCIPVCGGRRASIFDIGERVRHKTRPIAGKVLEIDGKTVYLEASNGVEMQFGLDDLESDTPAPAQVKAAAVAAVQDAKHQVLFEKIPASVAGLAAVRYARDPAARQRGWGSLSPTEKLDWVGRATGLSLAQLATLVRDGKARQIEAHAAVASGKAAGR
jgi:hypothetical protein